eukprot:760272-Hanusia_phi.AAC.1
MPNRGHRLHSKCGAPFFFRHCKAHAADPPRPGPEPAAGNSGTIGEVRLIICNGDEGRENLNFFYLPLSDSVRARAPAALGP